MVYQSDCRYLPYSIHITEFMLIFFMRNGQNAKKNILETFLQKMSIFMILYKSILLKELLLKASIRFPTIFADITKSIMFSLLLITNNPSANVKKKKTPSHYLFLARPVAGNQSYQ